MFCSVFVHAGRSLLCCWLFIIVPARVHVVRISGYVISGKIIVVTSDYISVEYRELTKGGRSG